jgi:MoaA/NifB/PqqE/SkfB family radical SAM enzyme
MRGDQALGLLDTLARRGIDNLVLGGGEPFTWEPGLLPYAEIAKRRGFFVQVGTNGVALPDKTEHSPWVDRFVLPLDGPCAEVHDRLRHYKDSHFRLIRDRMARLRDAGKSITVSTVVTAWNIDTLSELGVLLADEVLAGMRLHAWHLYRFIPEGRGGRVHAAQLNVTETEYEAACAEMKAMDFGFTIFKRKDMRHSKTVDFFWYEGEALRIGSQVWGARPAPEPIAP